MNLKVLYTDGTQETHNDIKKIRVDASTLTFFTLANRTQIETIDLDKVDNFDVDIACCNNTH